MIVRALPDFNQSAYNNAVSPNSPEYDGLFYLDSGSSAITFFLSLFGKGKRVGIQVFTCSTVLDSIKRAGDVPLFMETNSEYFTTTLDIVTQHIHEIDILILSHICGIPNPDYPDIKKICSENNVIVLDDLCQTYHGAWGGQFLEGLSDNYVYSFFYDKPISATKGGALKVTECLFEQAKMCYDKLPQEREKDGLRNLNRLYWMSRLLLPKNYERDFRTWCSWELYILGGYPKSWPISILKLLVNPSISMRISKLMKKEENTDSFKKLSNVHIKYVQECMKSYANNNILLKDFCSHFGVDLPTYLVDERITCSIAKRAIVPLSIKKYIDDGSVELRLYNWNELIDNNRNYQSKSILTNHINIPISTRWYKHDDNNAST